MSTTAPTPITRIVTHHMPHLDEIFAIWLLRFYGNQLFSGLPLASIEYWSEDMAQKSWRQYLTEGTLLVGIGQGQFDEHPGLHQSRRENHCAATLVADALGLDDRPELASLLQYVLDNDLNGTRNPYELAPMVISLHRSYPDQPQVAIDWANQAITAWVDLQKQFFGSTAAEYAAKAELVEIKAGRRLLTVATIVTDNTQIPSYARSREGGQVAVCIVKNSQNQVSILPNRYHQLDLTDLVRMIRVGELRTHEEPELVPDVETLGSEGVLAAVPEWFYFKSGEMLFNGSPTHPHVPATYLELPDILALVHIWLESKSFEPDREPECRRGNCTSTPDSPCPWFDFGLKRCQTVRTKSANPQTA